jgi:type I restriction enzyme S subunit
MSKESPKEWQVLRIGDILSLEYGKGLPANERSKGNYPVFGSNGIVGYHEQFLVKGPGIVVGRKGTIGAVTWVDSDFWPIDTTYFVKTKNENVFLKWLFFKLKQSNLNKLSQSDVVPGLKRELVYHITIPLPPLPEQRRIAEVLGTVDSAIQKVGGAIESTERLKKGLMQRLLTRGIGHERFKESEVGRVPEEWEAKTIGEIAKTSSGGTPSRDKKEYFIGSIPWVKSGELKDNTIYDTEERITEKGLQNSSAKLFPKGTLLIALYGATVGKTGILGIDATTNQAVCAILSKKDLIDQKFLQYFLISRRKQLISISAGGAQPNISQEIIRLFKIPLPPLPEQRRIADILSAADRKLELERRRKEKLERVKKGMMNELLTGRKRAKIE